MPVFRSKDWVNYGRWVQPTLSGTFWCHWFDTRSVRKFSAKFHPMLFLDGYSLMSASDQQLMLEIIGTAYSKNKIKALISKIEQVGKKAEKDHLDVLKSKHFTFSDYLPRLFATYNEVVGLWWFTLQLGDELEKFMADNRIPAKGLAEYVEFKAKKTWLQQQVIEIKNLAKQKNSNNFEKLVKAHVQKYAWLGTHHWMGEGFSVEKCLQHISQELKKPQQTKEIKRQLNPNKLWDLMATLTYWRTHAAEVTAKVVFESRPKLTEFGDKFGLTYDQVIYFSHREILQALKHKKLAIPKNFLERRKAYGCYLEKGSEKIITGKALKHLISLAVKERQSSNRTIFKGVVASPGEKVKARIKIIISPKDFSKFRKGDILMASETTPDFVPLMKIASAIVTERGGITSHAAIISRELGLPAIIGIRNATRVLKDGDLVEVDANKGIVKKL